MFIFLFRAAMIVIAVILIIAGCFDQYGESRKSKKDAQTKVINAKAEADANKILEKQLTNKILAQQWIKKWNGEVPKVSGDNKSMINIGELMK
jgi:predicted membrane protein